MAVFGWVLEGTDHVSVFGYLLAWKRAIDVLYDAQGSHRTIFGVLESDDVELGSGNEEESFHKFFSFYLC